MVGFTQEKQVIKDRTLAALKADPNKEWDVEDLVEEVGFPIRLVLEAFWSLYADNVAEMITDQHRRLKLSKGLPRY